MLVSFYCAHCERKVQDSVKLSTRNTFTFFQPQPELVLKMFLIFSQSEPQCSYKVIVLIKKSVTVAVGFPKF